jgi:carbonic anhydrase
VTVIVNNTFNALSNASTANGLIATSTENSYATPYWTPNDKTYFSLSGSITSPVPEQEEWAMLLLGLPLVGWVVRRKQSLAAAI